MKKPLQIAIDGPVGSGKGTLAVALSKKLNATHIYTGGMYRALALNCLLTNTDIKSEEAVFNLLKKTNIELKIVDGSDLTGIFLNGNDVTHDIFLPKVSNITPVVAAYKSVRKEMVKRQQEIIKDKAVVAEGRDTASDIIPSADIKIFLTADSDVRANRRYHQLKERNLPITLEEVKQDTVNRDTADSKRDASPLRESSDSFVVDTTNDSIDDTIQKVINELKNRNLI